MQVFLYGFKIADAQYSSAGRFVSTDPTDIQEDIETVLHRSSTATSLKSL